MSLKNKSDLRLFLARESFFQPHELWLTPGELAAGILKRDLLLKTRKGGQSQAVILEPRLMGMGRLEQTLSSEIPSQPLIDQWSRSLILESLTPSLLPALGLKDLSPALLPALAQSLGEALGRLSMAGLKACDIKKAGGGPLHSKLAELWGLYEKELRARGFVDESQKRLLLIAGLRKGRQFKALQGIKKVVCRGWSRFSPFETELIKALGRNLELELSLALPAWLRDKDLSRGYGRELVQTINSLERDAESRVELIFNTCPEAAVDRGSAPALAQAAEYLLSPRPPLLEEDPRAAIKISSVPGRYQEVEEAARQIKILLLKGEEPGKLALAAPALESYRPLIEDVGRRFGLNFHFRRGSPLLRSGPVAAVFELLDLWSSHWEMERLAGFLRNPHFRIFSAQKARELALKGGVSDERAGGGFEDNLKNSGEGRGLLEAVARLKSHWRKLIAHPAWPDFLAAFNSILEDLGWPGESPGGQGPAWDRAAAQAFKKELAALAETLKDPLAPPPSLAAFSLWLEKILAGVYLNIQSKKPESSVWAVNYDDLHGGDFHHVFFLGLNERSFPRIDGPASFWPVEFSRSFEAISPRKIWTTASDNYRRDEEMFAAALFQAKEKAWLYYSRQDADSRPALPSPIINILKDLWPRHELEEETGAGDPAPEQAASPDEMWRLLAARKNPPKGPLAETWRALKKRRLRFREQGARVTVQEKLYRSRLFESVAYDGQPMVTVGFLSAYAQCPLKFWFSQILGLRPDEDALEEWARTSEGNLAHRVLEKFFANKLGENFPGRFKNLDEAADELNEIFLAESRLFNEPKGRRPLWRIRHERLFQKIFHWLGRRLADEDDFIPRGLEWSFGLQEVPPLKIETGFENPGEDAALYLRGRIDRLDETKGGLRAVDYKLSYKSDYKPKRDQSLSILSWPAAVYSLAASRHFGRAAKARFEFLEPAGSLECLELPDSQTPALTLELCERKQLEREGFFNLPETLCRLWRDLGKGIFDPAGALGGEPDCSYCPYEFICPHWSL